jgi:hypothetical protein
MIVLLSHVFATYFTLSQTKILKGQVSRPDVVEIKAFWFISQFLLTGVL